MAVGITVRPAPAGYDLGASKFFGTPTVPLAWLDTFDEDEIFLCQLRLVDVAPFDGEGVLPHEGYLYVFWHTDTACADVRYAPCEPEAAIDEFNAAGEGYEAFGKAWLCDFAPADAAADGIRLLGEPSDWPYDEAPPRLLLQFDPLGSDMGFLDSLDGYVYLFWGDDVRDFSAVSTVILGS